MGRKLRRCLPALVIFAAACGGQPRPAEKADTDPVPLLIWVEDDDDWNAADLLSGCREWGVKGIQCHLVTDKWKSDVRVYIDREDPCATKKNGRRTLARAWQGGRIVFYHRCFLKKNGLDRHMVRAVGVHEFGHQLGIWTHVPEDCDDDDVRTHDGGGKICGQAVMNPLYEKDVHFVTEIDALAFDLRDRSIGVVRNSDGVSDREPDCIYHTRP